MKASEIPVQRAKPREDDSSRPAARRCAILFANLKGNLGDFAILAAMLAHIERRTPGSRVDIYAHQFTSVDEARTKAFMEKYRHRDITVAGKTYYTPVPNWCKRLRRLGLWKPVQAYFVQDLASRAIHDADKFAGYDEILVAGGDQWNGRELGISMFGTLVALRQVNTSISSFPVSLNPAIGSFNSRQRLRRYFACLMEPVPLRDSLSAATAARIGIPHVEIPDSVFSLAEHATQIGTSQSSDRSRILISAAATQVGFEKVLEKVLEQLRPHFPNICLLTTCEPEDGEVYTRIAARLGIAYLAPTSWEDAIAEIKSSRLLITNRFHGLVFASLANTPVLAISDRCKSEAFSKDAALRATVSNLSNVTVEEVRRALDLGAETVEHTSFYRDRSFAQFQSRITSNAPASK